MPEAADHSHVARSDVPGSLRLGSCGQHRRQWFAGDRFALTEIGGFAYAPRCIGAGDAQSIGQCRGQLAAQLRRIGLLADLVDQRVFDGRQPTPKGLAGLQQCEPLRGSQRVEGQIQGALEVSLERIEDFDDFFSATRTHVRTVAKRSDNSALGETEVTQVISVMKRSVV